MSKAEMNREKSREKEREQKRMATIETGRSNLAKVKLPENVWEREDKLRGTVWNASVGELGSAIHYCLEKVDGDSPFAKKFAEVEGKVEPLMSALAKFLQWSDENMSDTDTSQQVYNEFWWKRWNKRGFPPYLQRKMNIMGGRASLIDKWEVDRETKKRRHVKSGGVAIFVGALINRLRVWEEELDKRNWCGMTWPELEEFKSCLSYVLSIVPPQEERERPVRRDYEDDEEDGEESDDKKPATRKMWVEPLQEQLRAIIFQATQEQRKAPREERSREDRSDRDRRDDRSDRQQVARRNTYHSDRDRHSDRDDRQEDGGEGFTKVGRNNRPRFRDEPKKKERREERDDRGDREDRKERKERKAETKKEKSVEQKSESKAESKTEPKVEPETEPEGELVVAD